jgi:DNA polymerase I-like protein with 3'-5' exonuclease and polymerase domains
MGAKACQQVIGRSVQITKVRGQVLESSKSFGTTPVLPMTSPFFARKHPESENIFLADLETLGRVARGGFKAEASHARIAVNYRWCYDLEHLLKDPPSLISLDVESVGLYPFDPSTRLLTVQLGIKPGESIIVPVDYDAGDLRFHNVIDFPGGYETYRPKIVAQLKRLLENTKVKVIGHNLKFDWLMLHYKLGIQIANYHADTILMAHLIDENLLSKSLDDLARLHVPAMAGYADEFNKDPVHQSKTRMDLVPPYKMIAYGCGDTDAALRLYNTLLPKLRRDKRLWACYRKTVMRAIRAFCYMEQTGFYINVDALREFEQYLRGIQEKEKEWLLSQIPVSIKSIHKDTGVGLQPDRDAILVDYLYNHPDGLRLKPMQYTKTGKPSVSSKTALPYYVADHPFIARLTDYIKNQKMLNTYISGFYKYIYDGRIRPSYSLHKTTTGRSCSDSPNGQNFPKRGKMAKTFRKAFQAPEGHVYIQLDLSQAELRIAAMISGDERMMQVYQEGGDIHRSTAAGIMGISVEEFLKLSKEVQDLKRFQSKCYTGDTEILTTSGFVRFDRLPQDVEVAQWESGVISFVKPLAFHRYENQKVVIIQDKSTDLSVTPNHRLLLFSRYTKMPYERAAEDLTYNDTAGSVLSCHAGYYPDSTDADPLFTRLLVMVQADGSYQNNGAIRLGFSKQRKINRCRELLDAAGVDYSTSVFFDSDKKAVTFFYLPKKDSVAKRIMAYMPDKTFDVSLLSVIDKEAFLDELPRWDGHSYKKSSRSLCFYSSSKRKNADFVQIVCTLSNRTSNLVSCSDKTFKVSFRSNERNPFKRNNWSVSTADNQTVYCVTVPSSYVVVRRNGRVTISGNSVNFGFLYGMWWKKFREYAKTDYGIDFTDEEAASLREMFFETYPRLAEWHSRVERWVKKRKYVRAFNGRIRHLPMVDSSDEAIAKQAIRQGINSPVQSFASDLGLMAIGLLVPYLRKTGLWEHIKICGFIHDSIICIAKEEYAAKTMRLVKKTMENLPLEKWFGWKPTVPIVADAEIGRNLAETYEVKPKYFSVESGNRTYTDIIRHILNDELKKLRDINSQDEKTIAKLREVEEKLAALSTKKLYNSSNSRYNKTTTKPMERCNAKVAPFERTENRSRKAS